MALEKIDHNNPLKEYMEYVVEDVNRCKGIVKNLLAYSRRSTTTKEIIQINELLEQSINLIRDQKLFGNIVISREMSKELILIHGDRNQLAQVIINLVMNASAAMNGQGLLTLRTYRDKPNRKAYFEVSDTGCGIPEENLPKIFDPFFTTKEPGKGTGLGLSTSLGIIQENGGHISVKETGDKGTTFLVELPLFVPAESVEATEPENLLDNERNTRL
jgi:signal transduction histidine kinase